MVKAKIQAPLMLTRLKHWVVWDYRDGRKLPFQPNGKIANPSDPNTWSSFTAVTRKVADYEGVGFVLTDSDFGAIDLDDCRDPKTKRVAPWAERIIDDADGAYVEITPSRRGFRIIGKAIGAEVHTVVRMGTGKFELYRDCIRYITVTGDRISGRVGVNIDRLIDSLAPKKLAPKHTVVDDVDLNEALSMDWRDVVKRRRPVVRHLVETKHLGGIDRSSLIFRIVKELRDGGATPNEAACVLYASTVFQSKHGKNLRTLEAEVRRICRK